VFRLCDTTYLAETTKACRLYSRSQTTELESIRPYDVFYMIIASVGHYMIGGQELLPISLAKTSRLFCSHGP